MIEKMKNNTKIKIISFLTAIVLWLYVMAVVDPEDTKLFEDLPIIITNTNMNELKANNLVIYPEIDLETDIYLNGKLSSIQKIKKDDIHIYGQINNPMEGNNQLFLKANISERVSYEFKPSVMIINLEKLVQEKRAIEVKKEGKSKENIEEIKLDEDSVKVSGPRSLVQKVQKIEATLDVGSQMNDFSTKIKLIPIDENGDEVEGVTLDKSHVNANVTLLKEKNVPIKIKFKEDIEVDSSVKGYTLSQETINIKGKKDIIDKIDSITTQEVDLSNVVSNTQQDIYLQIPEGVKVENKFITIKLEAEKKLLSEFVYTPEEIEIRNNTNEISLDKIIIPESIAVTVEYDKSISNLAKSDLVLFVDLANASNELTNYDIKYESKYEFKNVTINPNKIEISN